MRRQSGEEIGGRTRKKQSPTASFEGDACHRKRKRRRRGRTLTGGKKENRAVSRHGFRGKRCAGTREKGVDSGAID